MIIKEKLTFDTLPEEFITTKNNIKLMAIDPSYESMQLSSKIYNMAKSMNKPIYFILNKVDEKQAEIMKDTIEHKEAVIATMYYAKEILTQGLLGKPIDYPSVEINNIIKSI